MAANEFTVVSTMSPLVHRIILKSSDLNDRNQVDPTRKQRVIISGYPLIVQLKNFHLVLVTADSLHMST